tara:strand:+ start:991 stop:1611 length:621 start_codon:yes stop_codon:yes gene_type:complete
MLKKVFYISLLPLIILLTSCGGGMIGGQYQENLAKLDDIYGYCDNPQRGYNKSSIEYKVCKDKESAAGADGLADTDFRLPFVDDLLNNRGSRDNLVYTSSVNKYLWSGSLNILSDYPLKTADSNGGYLETEWIYDNRDGREQRCIIKIQINTIEFVSNGVETNIICQTKQNSEWMNMGENFINAEKQLTLAILNSSRNYYLEDQNS